MNTESRRMGGGSTRFLHVLCRFGLPIVMMVGPHHALAQSVAPPRLAPLLNEQSPYRIPGQYIVVFKQGVTGDKASLAMNRAFGLGGKVRHQYRTALHGFSASLPAQALEAIRRMPEVAYIEVDQVARLETVQVGPPAGLDRTSERLLPLDNRYTYSETGTGVHVYVIDTGIRASHAEFGGRVSGGTNTMNPAVGTGDCHGHGTHVAGTVGGATYGIAKNVQLHPVRAGDCFDTYLAPLIAAADWVTANRVLPAVVNLSSRIWGGSAALDTAVSNSIASGVVYVLAAGNDNNNACSHSPGRVPEAITVGAVDPANDTRAWFSNTGNCLDLFAPGVDTLSAGIVNDTSTDIMSGTSMSAPHVAGVAARYLQTHPLASPAAVWTAIHNANNVLGVTPGWTGVVDPGTGSPNELLHYGSLNDGFDDGDPHIRTVNGLLYDFQTGGEFVALRSQSIEIQTRQRPVDSLPWVSVNTAVAARVGKYRVTWQPGTGVMPDPDGLELRIDGALTAIPAGGIALGTGARVSKLGENGISIDFPDGTTMTATANWWGNQKLWYLNVRAYHTMATEGIMGVLKRNEWLEPDFSDRWRVTKKNSLFDYAYGVVPEHFASEPFPSEKVPPMEPENVELAKKVCARIKDKKLLQDCLFDVGTTGDPVFAAQEGAGAPVSLAATSTALHIDDVRRPGAVTLTARVVSHARRNEAPTGFVRFLADGRPIGTPIALDARGQAQWTGTAGTVAGRALSAEYVPAQDSPLLTSHSDRARYSQDRIRQTAPAIGARSVE